MKKFYLVIAVAALVTVSCKTKMPLVSEEAFTHGETDIDFVDFDQISLGPEELPIIQAMSSGLSPNGDGISDSISFAIHAGKRDKIINWKISIKNEKSEVVEIVTGGKKIPDIFNWGGLNKDEGLSEEGLYKAELSVSYTNLKTYLSETAAFTLALTGPECEIKLSEGYFSPDSDGSNDLLKVMIKTAKRENVASWEMDIIDPAGIPFYILKDAGEAPDKLVWNGKKNNSDEVVQSAMDYEVKVILTDLWGNKSEISETLNVDVLVFKDGERFRIRIAAITFLPYTADFYNVPEQQLKKNIETLDILSEKLKKFKQYKIMIEGHAVHVFWFDEKKKKIEQDEILLELSKLRSEVIKTALVERGIENSRMTTDGVGGNNPLVPFSDLQNRWINRRVEFLLVR